MWTLEKPLPHDLDRDIFKMTWSDDLEEYVCLCVVVDIFCVCVHHAIVAEMIPERRMIPEHTGRSAYKYVCILISRAYVHVCVSVCGMCVLILL